MPFGCQQCKPCRIKRKRIWVSRNLLELYNHEGAAFVTLTYDEKNYPKDGSLSIEDYQNWLKRLRYYIAPRKLRYYIVGEYGSQTQRAHYHAIIFGVSYLEESLLKKSWDKGFLHVGDVNESSIGYTMKYITKGMTQKNHPNLNGRIPEFARMSLKPGIGADTAPQIAKQLQTEHGSSILAYTDDVPQALQQGRKSLPLGKYIRNKIRAQLGMVQKTPDHLLKIYQTEMQNMYKEANKEAKYYEDIRSPKQILQEVNKQKILNIEGKLNLFEKKGDL